MRGAAAPRQCFGLRSGKKLRHVAKRGVVLLDVVGKRRDPWLGLDRLGAGVKRRHRAAERIGERRIDLARLRQSVERRVFVEAAHLERPFDRRAGAVEREPAAVLARDRDHAAVDVGRERSIDAKLGLAGFFALGECRIVQKGKAHGALDLQGALAGEKYRRPRGCRRA